MMVAVLVGDVNRTAAEALADGQLTTAERASIATTIDAAIARLTDMRTDVSAARKP